MHSTTTFVPQIERVGGQVGHPVIYWDDHHRTYQTVAAANIELERLIKDFKPTKHRTGRFRVIRRIVATVETESSEIISVPNPEYRP